MDTHNRGSTMYQVGNGSRTDNAFLSIMWTISVCQKRCQCLCSPKEYSR